MGDINMQTIKETIRNSIYGHGRGWAFTKKDFSHVAPSKAVYSSLSRLADEGIIRRISHGIYDYPQFSKLLNSPISPDMEKIAKALARKFGWRIYPEGETALNILGLSTQVPSKYVYLTDGPNKSLEIGNRKLVFKKRSTAQISLSYETSLIIQAMKSLGRSGITQEHIRKISSQLSKKEKNKLLRETKNLADWIYEYIKIICKGPENG